jgi:uncharacterized protein YjbJ (UPF0337 family)
VKIHSQAKATKMSKNKAKKAPTKKVVVKGTAKTPPKTTWVEQKVALKKQFPALTDSDMMFEEGKKEEMLAKVQIKIGKTKEELQKIIAAF